MMTKPGARDKGSRRGGGSHRKQGGRHHPVTAVQAPDSSKQDLGSNAYRYEEHVSSRDDDFNPEVLQLNRRRQKSDADAFDALMNQSLHTALHQHRETSSLPAEGTLTVDLNVLAINLRSVPLHTRLDIAPDYFAAETIAEFNRDAAERVSQDTGTQPRAPQAAAAPAQLHSFSVRNQAPLSASASRCASTGRDAADATCTASEPLGRASSRTAERGVPAPSTAAVGTSSTATASSTSRASRAEDAVPGCAIGALGPARHTATQSREVSPGPAAAFTTISSNAAVGTGRASGEPNLTFPGGRNVLGSRSMAAAPPIPTVAAALSRAKADEQDDDLDFLLGL